MRLLNSVNQIMRHVVGIINLINMSTLHQFDTIVRNSQTAWILNNARKIFTSPPFFAHLPKRIKKKKLSAFEKNVYIQDYYSHFTTI